MAGRWKDAFVNALVVTGSLLTSIPLTISQIYLIGPAFAGLWAMWVMLGLFVLNAATMVWLWRRFGPGDSARRPPPDEH
jgi:hypothetical protein